MTKTDERKSQSAPAAVFIGGLIGIAAALALLLAAAVLIKKELLPFDAQTPVICAAGFVGALIGGLVAAKSLGRRFALNGAAVGLAMFALRTAAAIICHGSIVSGAAMMLLLSLTAGGFFGGLLSSRKGKRRRR